MSLNAVPSADRIHIGIFGKRNAGKSSIINAVTCQNLAIVSDIKGTTTDPVQKAMELLPLGPVVIIDTPGLDDEGELGTLRIRKESWKKSRRRKFLMSLPSTNPTSIPMGRNASSANPQTHPAAFPSVP